MIMTYIIGIGGIIALAILWLIVQRLWRKSFEEYIMDDDVLAERGSCSNCGCGTICRDKNAPSPIEK